MQRLKTVGICMVVLSLVGIALAALNFKAGPTFVANNDGTYTATGELTGYIAGRSGRLLVLGDPSTEYGPVGRLVSRLFGCLNTLVGEKAFLTLFMLAAIPNPLFDAAGMTAGSLGYSPWRYWLAVALGKSIVYTTLALGGQALLR